MASITFAQRFFEHVADAAAHVDAGQVEALAAEVAAARARHGRVFLLGVGGGAAHASHAAADFRLLGDVEAYACGDNAAELTARVNDDGWDGGLAAWLRASRVGPADLVVVVSVGGGDPGRGISVNLVEALRCAQDAGARTAGVVGRDGGATGRIADVCVLVPDVAPSLTTPLTEGLQSMVLHAVVAHPAVARRAAKWERELAAGP